VDAAARSYNVIEIDDEAVRIMMRRPGSGEEPLARFAREPRVASEFFPALDRFVATRSRRLAARRSGGTSGEGARWGP
jgi:hypothetical protein